MGNKFGTNKKCVFCDILTSIDVADSAEYEKVLHYNDKLAILADIHPAAKHHYLVVPREHTGNPNTLHSEEHAELIEDMLKFGKEYMRSLGTDDIINDSRYGFHFPPFISVEHLHMHMICPSSTMNFMHSNLFRENTWYFISPEKLIEWIKQKFTSV